ncbi:MAG TPA: lactate racemase domain-containing protein [bacterium]|nr:lactate racemase domain-containing protein [bacterium]
MPAGTPTGRNNTPSTAAADLAAALAQPHALPPLAELCRAKRVTLFIGDKTRSTPRAAAGRALLEQLRPATAVQIFITTGSHAATAPEDRAVIDQLVAYAATLGITASGHIHDCRHDPLLACGTTPRGTAVELNARALAADVLVVHSDVKPHYFAGYSNATKHLLPGISGYPGIEQNHALALDPAAQFGHHPWHPQPSRRQNPLAEDLLDAYQLAVGNRPVFVLATISDHDCVRWAAAGAAATVMAEAFAELDRSSLQQVVPCRHAVISCGGYPLDETLYTAHAGLEMVRAAIAPGGEVLLLAECADGVAPNESAIRHFYEPLCRPLAELTAGNPATYRLGAHKTVRLAQFLSRHTLFLTSALPPETVRAIHCHPAPEPQAIVDRWLQQQASILVINHANKLALLPASPPSGQH